MSQLALSLENVSKRYGDFHAVSDLSLEVPAGMVYGFLGPNGAGKTTTLRMILDILRPSAGRIRVLGSESAMEVRHRIGYLPEEKGLYKKMQAWSIVAYFASLKGVRRASAKRRAFELLAQYGLKDFARAKTEALSKGMGQKVQMLTSIAHDPELVILDEPFSGLDPVNQGVMEEILTHLKSRGRTVIFCTHVMAHAERLCDRFLILARGRKRFDGTLEAARQLLPKSVEIRTASPQIDITPLTELPQIQNWSPLEPGHYRISMEGSADPQEVLQACFKYQIVLNSFQTSEPSLHDVFVLLVGADAREATHR